MKYLIIFITLVALSMGQRPTYAGISAKGYPELASRFRDPAADEDQDLAVANRVGGTDDTAPPNQNIPTDARGDVDLVNRFNQWPRENRPFWLLNAEHIEKHRHPNGMRTNQQNGQQINLQEQMTVQGQQNTNGNQPTNERQRRQLPLTLENLFGY